MNADDVSVSLFEPQVCVADATHATDATDATESNLECTGAPLSWNAPFSLAVPQLAPDSVWMEAASLSTPSVGVTEAQRALVTITTESATYQARLTEQLTALTARGTAELSAMQSETDALKAALDSLEQELEDQLESLRKTQPSRLAARLTTFPTPKKEAASAHQDDASKLVAFWKSKHTHVSKSVDLLDEELESIRSRISDLRSLHTPDQFNALRLIGERRSEEAAHRELINGLRERMYQLTSSVPLRETDRAEAKEKFSVIDRRIVDREMELLKDLCIGSDLRLKAGKAFLHSLQRRSETLVYRIADLKEKTREAKTCSLDKTLEHALELRSKVGQLGDLQSSDLSDLIEKNSAIEDALRVELENCVARTAHQCGEMQRELRERRVRVIRAIHSSGGNIEARFDLLRAHQHVAVVNRQFAAAESDRVALQLQVSQASGSATRALDFLKRAGGSE